MGSSGRGRPGRCQVFIKGERCVNTWEHSYVTRRFCRTCKIRLKQRRYRARKYQQATPVAAVGSIY